MKNAITASCFRFLAVATVAVLMGGCATPPPAPKVVKEPVFFPPAPDEPHIQFLCHFHGTSDLAKPRRSSFLSYLLGSTPESFDSAVKPYGIAVLDHKIYIADSIAHRIVVFDLAAQKMDSFGLTGRGLLKKPINIRVGPDRNLYVADTLREQVVVFDVGGNYVTEYGAPKVRPMDVIVTDTELFVLNVLSESDADQNITVFDKTTRQIKRKFGSRGVGPGKFNFPTNLATDKDGNIYVCDSMNMRIQKLDREGKCLLSFGKAGDNPGTLSRPRGLAVDKDGIIYVVDARLNAIQLFDKTARLLTFIGGLSDTMDLPAQITIDYDNVSDFAKYIDPGFVAEYLFYVTNQWGPNKVSVFAFGHSKTPMSPPAPTIPATTNAPAATPVVKPPPTPAAVPVAAPAPAPAPAK